MINIRPVSDLRNKYPEIEDLVLKENEEVYLTKNGYGTMVIMSIKKYETIMTEVQYAQYIENALDEAEEEAKKTDVRYTHEEVFSEMRGMINRKNKKLPYKE